ncbi:MAG: TolC family protein [Endomicrobia bacterium]|nr:TolC family protein [Endomicrobiia bacterium]MCL2507501.1 TolC family protein [Endomicrobiia bacterium]
MKRASFFRIFISLIFVFSAAPSYAKNYERILTEDSSVQTALAINQDILIKSQNVEAAKQRIIESKSLYFPKIDLNLNVSRFNNSEPMIIMGDLSPSPVYLPGLYKDIYFSTRLSVKQSIYSGGRIRTTNKLAEMNMNKMKNEEHLAKMRVVNNVRTVFNDCLFYKETIRYHNSLLSGRGLSRAEARETERNIEIAQFNFDREMLNLLSAIGLELNTIADISGDFKPQIKSLDLNQCIILAYQFKPEIQMTQYQESMDGLMVNLLTQQRYPTISVGAAQEWLGDRVIGDESSWYVALNANIPIFDGGVFARNRQGKINTREATLKRSQIEENVRLEVSKALLEYNFWKRQAVSSNLLERSGNYTLADLEIIHNLNRSYFALELAVGVQLDSY